MTVETRRSWAIGALVGLIVGVVMLGVLVGPPPAHAGNFCTNVTLAPYGSGGDRCLSVAEKNLDISLVENHERAGCADITDTSNNLVTEWVCGAAGTNVDATISAERAFEHYWKAIIRNNNVNNSGVFTGHYNCLGAGC